MKVILYTLGDNNENMELKISEKKNVMDLYNLIFHCFNS